MAAPIGDMVSQLMNPNADMNLAAAITPNPNPLAQQDQDCAATSGSANLPNAAVTKQDPTVANLAMMLLQDRDRTRAAEGINQGHGGWLRASAPRSSRRRSRRRLRGGGGGANPIGDVSDIMGIQKQVQDQNEYARFHANVGVFASSFRDHGSTWPSAGWGTEDNPKFMDPLSSALGGNVTQTPKSRISIQQRPI